MKTETLGKALMLIPLLLSSAFVNAKTDLDAVEACSEAITLKIEEKRGSNIDLQFDNKFIDSGSMLGKLTVFHLDVFSSSTNEVVGKYNCYVNRHARVRSLRSLSIDAPSAENRSRI